MRERNVFIIFLFTIQNVFSQPQELSRSSLIKENVSIVKIYILRSEEPELKTVHFVNDSGLISKTIDFSLSHNKTDTAFIEYYFYDSLNRNTGYESKQFYDSGWITSHSTYHYNEKGFSVVTHFDNDSAIHLYTSEKSGRIYKNYLDGSLYSKSIHKKQKKETVYYFYYNDHRHTINLLKTIYHFDKKGNMIQSDSYYFNKINGIKYNRITNYTYDKDGKCKMCHFITEWNEPVSFCKYYEYIKRN